MRQADETREMQAINQPYGSAQQTSAKDDKGKAHKAVVTTAVILWLLVFTVLGVYVGTVLTDSGKTIPFKTGAKESVEAAIEIPTSESGESSAEYIDYESEVSNDHQHEDTHDSGAGDAGDDEADAAEEAKPEMVPCHECGGAGRFERSSTTIREELCSNCDGDGEIEVGGGAVMCEDCAGSGIIETGVASSSIEQCDECEGTGQVEAE